MAFLKYAIVFVALFAAACAINASWGVRYSNDILLWNETVLRNPVANTFLEVDVVYPKSGTNKRIVTAIFVYDRFTNTSGAVPNLLSGGPNYINATVSLKSQLSRGINSIVEIWGR